MAYVIVDTCTKDELCVEACPVDCIHPKKDEPGFEEAPHLCRSRGMHRLWGLHSGLSNQFRLRSGRLTRGAGALRREERGVLFALGNRHRQIPRREGDRPIGLGTGRHVANSVGSRQSVFTGGGLRIG